MCSSFRRICLTGAALLLAGAAGAEPNELGRPILRHYTPGEHLRGISSQVVTQDALGTVYFGNGVDVLTYDGARWGYLQLPTESAGVRQFAVAADGTIFLGGAGVLGFLRGSGASLEFVSLLGQLPPAARNVDEIHHVATVGDAVCFADEEKILVWRTGRFTVIPYPTPRYSHGARFFRVGDALYVTALTRGLGRLNGDRIESVADDPVLRENQFVHVESGAGESLVLLSAERGFFRLEAGRIAPLPMEANRWLEGKRIFRALRLGDGSLVVAFSAMSGDGGMRFAADGRYQGPLDTSIGLLAKSLRDFFCDREGGLWIGMEVGAARLEWPSPATVFDVVNGLGQGGVNDVTRHAGVLYAATNEGLFRLVPMDEAGRGARFERIRNQPVSALVSHPGGLLALSFGGLLVQTPDGFSTVVRLPSGEGTLLRSQLDLDRVWIGAPNGLRSVRHGAQGWSDEGPVSGFAENCRELCETADGALWVSTPDRGIFRLVLAANHGTAPRIERFAADRAAAHAVAPTWGGNVPPLPHLITATVGSIQRVRTETGPEGDVLWACGNNGLARIEAGRVFPASVSFATQLTTKDVREGDRLPPEHGTLTFNYVAPRQRPTSPVVYQTRMVGFETDWSEWSPKRERTFAHLSSGRYRFEARARDAEGVLSAPASLGFVILSAWWATWWAISGYVFASLMLVAGVVQVRTRALRDRAALLEATVAERTAELARQNTELVRLNRLELDEKISARLAEEKARLEVLRYQLNPHFLYNTLASISAALPAGLSTPRTMLERLAEFCRLTLHSPDERHWTSLGEEVRLLRAYLEIEQSRWGDLLDVEIACDPALDGEPLPHFLLLPLVENALKYGRATSADRVGVRLSAHREGDGALVLAVANTGEWVEPATKKTVTSLGIGLENLRERLARHYPRAHELTVSHTGGWVTVVLRILKPPAS